MLSLPLDTIQGHVLKSFGRRHATYLLLRFESASGHTRRELSRLLTPLVTPAASQSDGRDSVPNPAVSFGISWTGYRRLGIEEAGPSNEEWGASLFRNGIRVGYWSPGTEDWDAVYAGSELDAFLLLADDDPDRLAEAVDRTKRRLAPTVAAVGEEAARRLTRNPRMPDEDYEHFGFRDGIAQPDDPSAVFTAEPRLRVQAAEASYGCFAVWMKIEQHRDRLRKASAELCSRAAARGVQMQAAEIEEMCVGRRRDGTALALNQSGDNEFTFHDVPPDLCPFQAHIRAMNPRVGEPTRLIVRRGMVYGTEEAGGLLFLAFLRSLTDFLFLVQRSIRWRDPILARSAHWTLDDTSPVRAIDRGRPAQNWNLGGQEIPYPIADLTTLRGGEYFYMPSLNFIRALGET